MKKLIRALAFFTLIAVVSATFGIARNMDASATYVYSSAGTAINVVNGIVPTVSEAGIDGTAITDGDEETVVVASNTQYDFSCDIYVTWDLGSKKTIRSYDLISWKGWYQTQIDTEAKGYQGIQAMATKDWTFEISDDNTSFRTIDTVTENLDVQVKKLVTQEAAGRYIRFHITKKCGKVSGGATPWAQLVIAEIRVYTDMPIVSSVTLAPAGQISNLVNGLVPTYSNHTPGDDRSSPPTSALTDGVTSGDNTYAEWYGCNTGYHTSTSISALFTWDLGKACAINDYQVWLSSDTARAAKNFTVDVSNDGVTWIIADTVTNNNLSYIQKNLSVPYVAKYVRFHFTKSSETGFSWPALTIFEMKVNGTPGTTFPTNNLVGGKTPTVSETVANAAAATDGNEATLMVTGNTGGNDYSCNINVTWDLGSKKSYKSYDYLSWNSWYQSQIDAQAAGYKNYQAQATKDWTVQVSDDNINFSTVDTVVGNLNTTVVRTLPQEASGRYIRFHFTKKCGIVSGGAAPWSQLVITELKVYGTPASPKQIVSGVSDGSNYFKKDGNLTIGFINECTATLNGKAFLNGGSVSATGSYTLVVTDEHQNATTINFVFIMYGDVNGDGLIDATDVSLIEIHLQNMSILVGAFKLAGNISGSGEISASDVSAIKEAVLNHKTEILNSLGRPYNAHLYESYNVPLTTDNILFSSSDSGKIANNRIEFRKDEHLRGDINGINEKVYLTNGDKIARFYVRTPTSISGEFKFFKISLLKNSTLVKTINLSGGDFASFTNKSYVVDIPFTADENMPMDIAISWLGIHDIIIDKIVFKNDESPDNMTYKFNMTNAAGGKSSIRLDAQDIDGFNAIDILEIAGKDGIKVLIPASNIQEWLIIYSSVYITLDNARAVPAANLSGMAGSYEAKVNKLNLFDIAITFHSLNGDIKLDTLPSFIEIKLPIQKAITSGKDIGYIESLIYLMPLDGKVTMLGGNISKDATSISFTTKDMGTYYVGLADLSAFIAAVETDVPKSPNTGDSSALPYLMFFMSSLIIVLPFVLRKKATTKG